jgi:hypothetical protein
MLNQAIMGLEFIDRLRYDHFMGGANFDEIGNLEDVASQIVYASVERESRPQRVLMRSKLLELRRQGEVANERFRQQLRRDLADDVARAIEKLRPGGRIKSR